MRPENGTTPLPLPAAPPVAAPPADRGGPLLVQPRIRTAMVRLTGDYAGVEVAVRLNPSIADRQALQSGDEPRMLAAVVALIAGWNLADTAGQPLPVTLAALESLPDDLVGDLLHAWAAERARPLATPTNGLVPSSPVASD